MPELITLNDGTEVAGHCIEDLETGTLFMYLDGKSVAEGIALIDGNIERIEEENHGAHHTYEGYTEIYAVSHEYGNCNIVLKKE